MEVFRRLMGGGGDGDGGEEGEGEEDALLLYEEGNSSSSSSEMEPEEQDERPDDRQQRQFDVSLPARHLYLGDLEEEGRVAMEDEEATPTLPLLYLPQRVLFPGEVLPMHISNPHAIQMLRNAATLCKPVAIVTDLREAVGLEQLRRPSQTDLSQVGTTAEVLALKDEYMDTAFWNIPCLVVKFLGRQRFRLLNVIRKANGQLEGQVVILPEQLLPPRPLHLFSCPPHIYTGYLAGRLSARNPSVSLERRLEADRYCRLMERPSVSSSLCPVPAWVFTLYDTEYLRGKIIREQMMMVSVPEGLQSGELPEDVVSLSYWLSRRLPVSDRDKLNLLSLHCPTLRLLRGLQILENFTDLCCASCGTLMTQKSHIFSMSVDGPIASYVNPGGFIHDTLTARQAQNLRRQGRPSTEHSWFPGYSWTILNCGQCWEHKGWLFKATRKNLSPAEFYGLRRDGLQHKTKMATAAGGMAAGGEEEGMNGETRIRELQPQP